MLVFCHFSKWAKLWHADCKFFRCQNDVEKKMQSLLFNEGGASPQIKNPDKINPRRLGLVPLLKKIAFPEKPLRFGTVFARFLLVKNLWIGE